jgi:hypothetical protein
VTIRIESESGPDAGISPGVGASAGVSGPADRRVGLVTARRVVRGRGVVFAALESVVFLVLRAGLGESAFAGGSDFSVFFFVVM